MKKTAIAVAVAVAAFASVAQAAPKDNTWYTGGKLGWSQYQNTGSVLETPVLPIKISSVQVCMLVISTTSTWALN